MPHDPVLIAEVRAWLTRAAMDLRAAEQDRLAEPPITADIVFHAQQMVEKSLKAFLAWHDRPFRKTHNLIELGQACVNLESKLESIVRKAAPLTQYAWQFRYPGEPEEPGIEEADEALSLAKKVYKRIRKFLPEETCP